MLRGKWVANTQWKENLPDWMNQFIIGEPQGTAEYTGKELGDMGMVGLYERIELGPFDKPDQCPEKHQ